LLLVFLFSEKHIYSRINILLTKKEVLIMSTKPPASIVEFPAESLEKLAYSIAADIPTEELNDVYRLGYCIWGWLSERRGTLLQTVSAAGARSKLTFAEMVTIIEKRLEEKGIKISN
jgi:hypothetical protein